MNVAAAAQTFLVPVLDRWLLCAPLHGVSALLNRSAARELAAATSGLPQSLAALGHPDLGEPKPAPGAIEGPLVPSRLGIIPTRGCNMHCVYCNFAGTSNAQQTMPRELAVAVVDWAAQQRAAAGERSLHIQFFGGEPFIARDIVECIVARARDNAARLGLDTYFDASTNGLFNEQQCEWIGHNFDAVVLSLDGPPAQQDRCRPMARGRPSSPTVQRNARALGRMPVDLCLRMCVTQESVREMADNARWMIENFAPSAIDFESLTASDLATYAGLAAPDPYEFAVQADRVFALAEAADVEAVYAAVETDMPRLSLCPVGTDVVIVSPDGRLSACYLMPEEWLQRGLNLDIGRFDAQAGACIDTSLLDAVRQLPATRRRCERCFCKYTCAGGCHVNLAGTSRPYADYCVQTRLIAISRTLRKMGLQELCDAWLADRIALTRSAQWSDDAIAPDSA